MADRPIIFSGPMVQALLAGRKTQTRRLMPYQEALKVAYNPTVCGRKILNYACEEEISRARFAPGDRLYVREAFIGPYAYEVNDYPPRDWGNKAIWFPADGPAPDAPAKQFWHRARPSIHMPRWASRLTLTVTDVRVQQLQDISASDSIAEGVQCSTCQAMKESACHRRGCFASVEAFRNLWNSLHGPDAWAENPWVVALTFGVEQRNIDAGVRDA